MKMPFFDACPCKSMYKNILLCSLLVRLGSLQNSELIFRLVAAALAAAAAVAEVAADGFLRKTDRFVLRVDRHADAGIESLSFFDIFRLLRVLAVLFPVFNFAPCNNVDSFFFPLRALPMLGVVYRPVPSVPQQSRLLSEFVWPNEVCFEIMAVRCMDFLTLTASRLDVPASGKLILDSGANADGFPITFWVNFTAWLPIDFRVF